MGESFYCEKTFIMATRLRRINQYSDDEQQQYEIFISIGEQKQIMAFENNNIEKCWNLYENSEKNYLIVNKHPKHSNEGHAENNRRSYWSYCRT